MANGDSTTCAVSDLKNVSNLKIVSLRTPVSNRRAIYRQFVKINVISEIR